MAAEGPAAAAGADPPDERLGAFRLPRLDVHPAGNPYNTRAVSLDPAFVVVILRASQDAVNSEMRQIPLGFSTMSGT